MAVYQMKVWFRCGRHRVDYEQLVRLAFDENLFGFQS